MSYEDSLFLVLLSEIREIYNHCVHYQYCDKITYDRLKGLYEEYKKYDIDGTTHLYVSKIRDIYNKEKEIEM
jgi:hypothetical protein